MERSWAHLGPKRAPRAKMLQNPNVRTPYIGAKLEVKIDKKIDPEAIQNDIIF